MLMPETNDMEFENVPAGTHLAICYRLLDLGTQETSFQGEVKHPHQVSIGWELPNERMEDGRPFSMHKTYTLSSHAKSNLRKDLESWRGQAFSDDEFGKWDIRNILGVGCFLSVIHREGTDGKVWANIANVSKLPKGTEAGDAINEIIYFDLEAFDPLTYAKLSENMRAKIAKSPQYVALTNPDVQKAQEAFPGSTAAVIDEDPDETIPF